MAYKDLQPQKVTLEDMLLTRNKKRLLESLINNVTLQASQHNALTDAVETGLTDLKTLLDQAQLADGVDITNIENTLNAVNNLLSEAGAGANILSALGLVFTELNRRVETISLDVVVNTATGILDVDLTSFGFVDLTEYKMAVTTYGQKPVSASCDKVSGVLGKVYIHDNTEWDFNDTSIRFKDCSVSGEEVTVCVSIYRSPVQISATLTEADGDVTTVGGPAIPSV